MTVHAEKQPGKDSWFSDWAMGLMVWILNSDSEAPLSLYSIRTWPPPPSG